MYPWMADMFRHLRPESIVFYLDCAYKNFFYGINRQLSSCMRLYHNLGYLHILNLETVKNSFKPFDDAFENYFFVKLQKICFGFWINIERSAYKRNNLNVRQVKSVPMKTEKRFKAKTVTNNSLLHNSSKKHVLACSIEESTSAKDYKYSGKSHKSLESTCSDTAPLSKSEKKVSHKENGITFNKLKLESQKNKSNKIGIGPDNSSGFSEQPVVTSTQKKKRNKKLRNQPTPDKTVTTRSIVKQKQQDILKQGTVEDGENCWNSKSCYSVSLESSKFPKLHWEKCQGPLRSQEKSILFLENNIFPQSQRDVVDYTWDTDANKIEWAECEFNVDEELQDVSLPQNGTFCEKNEKILNHETEFDLKKKKRKRKKLSTPAETVSNVADQKPQNSPNWGFREDTGNNRGHKNVHSTTLKLQNINENDENERSLRRQEESAFLPDNIQFPQTQRNIGHNTWHTEATKMEWAECEVTEFNVEKELHDIPIPKTEALLAKNGKISAYQIEFNLQKKKRKKEKHKIQPSPDTTVSNVSEQKHEDTAEVVTQQDGQNNEDYKSCYPNPLKKSKLQNMDKGAESLNKQDGSVIFPDNNQYFYNQRSTDDNTWDTVSNEKEGAIRSTDENLHDVPVPKIKGFCKGKKKIFTLPHFLGNMDNISWDRVANERDCTRPDTIIYNTYEKLHNVSTPRIEAWCEKMEKILTHQLEFDSQQKKRKKGTSKTQPILDDTVFSNADQKRQDTSKLVIQQEGRKPEDGKGCNSTTLEASKLQNIDKVGCKETLKSQDKSLFAPENIQFSMTQRNIDGNTWDTLVNEIERSRHEVIGHNNNENMHNASISKTEALCEENESILNDQVEFDRLILLDQFLDVCISVHICAGNLKIEKNECDEVKTYTDFKHIDEHCRFTGKCESFSEISNNKISPGESDRKQQVEKFETNGKLNSYSNFTQKLINNEAYSRQNATASAYMSRPWYISQKLLSAKLDSLNQDSKQLSFTTCANQKLRINEISCHETTTALTSTTKSQFLPQKVDTKQVKWFETESKLLSLINCLKQNFTEKAIYSRQSVPSSGYGTKPHHASQNKQPSEEKVASKRLKNRKKPKNKGNVVSSKNTTESSTDIFVSDNQIVGTVYTKEEENVVQGAAMSSEKSFNSFNAGSSSKKLSILKDKEDKNMQSTVSNLKSETLPQLHQKKKKKRKGKGKKKKKANKQTTLPQKAGKVLPYSENLEFEFTNEDFSLITLDADSIFYDFSDDDDGLDSFVPAFNQSSPKSQRWDFWWRKWNWV